MKASVKSKSLKQEKRLAKELDAVLIPASGAVKHGGYDMKKDTHCIEAKYTDALHYILKYAELDKIRKLALAKNKVPAFIFEFAGSRNTFIASPCSDIPDTAPDLEIKSASIKLSENTLLITLNKQPAIRIKWVAKEIGQNWSIEPLDQWKGKNVSTTKDERSEYTTTREEEAGTKEGTIGTKLE